MIHKHQQAFLDSHQMAQTQMHGPAGMGKGLIYPAYEPGGWAANTELFAKFDSEENWSVQSMQELHMHHQHNPSDVLRVLTWGGDGLFKTTYAMPAWSGLVNEVVKVRVEHHAYLCTPEASFVLATSKRAEEAMMTLQAGKLKPGARIIRHPKPTHEAADIAKLAGVRVFTMAGASTVKTQKVEPMWAGSLYLLKGRYFVLASGLLAEGARLAG